MLAQLAAGADALYSLDQVKAYCLQPLASCTAEHELALSGEAPPDFRNLPGYAGQAVTLIYDIPAIGPDQRHLYEFLVAPFYRNYCFAFDSQRASPICTRRTMTRFALDPLATRLYSQLVQNSDVRIKAPTFMLGQRNALDAHILRDRDPTLALAGWYLMLTLTALGQMITRRNQAASLCIAIIGIAVFCRIITSSSGNFSGLTLLNPDIDRRIEYAAIAVIGVCSVEFFALLVVNTAKTFRKFLQVLLLLTALFIALASDPQLE